MVGEIVGGGIGLLGSIFGGIGAANQRRKMRQQLNQQDAENKSWYNANALSDYTQRSDAQNLMKQLRESLGRQNKAAANSAVVTGATPEQQAVQKEQSNKVISDTFSNLGAQGQQWKDNITDKYLARKDRIAQQRMGMMEQAAQSNENLMNSGLNMLGGSLGGILGGIKPQSGGVTPMKTPVISQQDQKALTQGLKNRMWGYS